METCSTFLEVPEKIGKLPINPDEHLYEYLAQAVDVYDADTVRVDIDLGFHDRIHGTPVRLLRIDAPEIRNDCERS